MNSEISRNLLRGTTWISNLSTPRSKIKWIHVFIHYFRPFIGVPYSNSEVSIERFDNTLFKFWISEKSWNFKKFERSNVRVPGPHPSIFSCPARFLLFSAFIWEWFPRNSQVCAGVSVRPQRNPDFERRFEKTPKKNPNNRRGAFEPPPQKKPQKPPNRRGAFTKTPPKKTQKTPNPERRFQKNPQKKTQKTPQKKPQKTQKKNPKKPPIRISIAFPHQRLTRLLKKQWRVKCWFDPIKSIFLVRLADTTRVFRK